MTTIPGGRRKYIQRPADPVGPRTASLASWQLVVKALLLVVAIVAIVAGGGRAIVVVAVVNVASVAVVNPPKKI